MEDLEDYFHRLDARRSELEEAQLAGGENEQLAAIYSLQSVLSCLFRWKCVKPVSAKDSGDSRPVPSVERFDDDDFSLLIHKQLQQGESSFECAICLADVLVGEDPTLIGC